MKPKMLNYEKKKISTKKKKKKKEYACQCRQKTQERQVRSLSQEAYLEKEMSTYSSILSWEISWTEKHGRLQSMGLQKSQTRLSN